MKKRYTDEQIIGFLKHLLKSRSGSKFRNECLNEQYFTSTEHARAVIAAWRRDYNEQRPHTALGGLTLRISAHRDRRFR